MHLAFMEDLYQGLLKQILVMKIRRLKKKLNVGNLILTKNVD